MGMGREIGLGNDVRVAAFPFSDLESERCFLFVDFLVLCLLRIIFVINDFFVVVLAALVFLSK